jgi:hypothetical protein
LPYTVTHREPRRVTVAAIHDWLAAYTTKTLARIHKIA